MSMIIEEMEDLGSLMLEKQRPEKASEVLNVSPILRKKSPVQATSSFRYQLFHWHESAL